MKKALTIGLTTALAVLSTVTPAVADGWSPPHCGSVTGDGSVTFTWNDGKTIAPTSGTLRPIAYTYGLAALDRPGTLLALSNTTLLSSLDAGCTWTAAGSVSGSSPRLVAARGDRAYAWDRSGNLTLATPSGATPITSPTSDVRGLGTDPRNGAHVQVVDDNGQLYDSADGGRSWAPTGVSAGLETSNYAAAFDPHNLRHVVLGGVWTGARVTFDGGRTWTAATGLGAPGEKINMFNVVISPASPNVVYAMALNLAEQDAGAPSDGRHIYRSVDGGRHFTPVVDQQPGVILPNGPVMAAHPSDPSVVYFVFGTSFAGYGTDIYRYDARHNRLTTAHNSYDRVTSIAFNPAVSRLMYLGVAAEGFPGVATAG